VLSQVTPTSPRFDDCLESGDISRFYNKSTRAHFYTASVVERDNVIATLSQFIYEGIACYALTDAEPGTAKVYRFFNNDTGAHFHSTQDDERDSVDRHLPSYIDEGRGISALPFIYTSYSLKTVGNLHD
jgi:hypothetical protein